METINIRKGIGSHQSAKMLKDEWLTPPEIIKSLGDFDLDPCSPINRPWNTAKKHFTINDNGLIQDWEGRVWCNPPYGLEASKWLSKLAEHDNGIALIFARTETKMFFEYVWNNADAVLFIEGRLHFHHVDGSRAKANAGAPSVLIAYGIENAKILKNCKIKGKFIQLTAG
ncbi:MAG: adenine methyltransferase, partial [Flavobacterium sp.]|nr:adenine methyltransferase [Flavobacterium sp.]